MTWTPERIERLRQFWLEGYSASVIAIDLGITRNMVLGKVHRMRAKGELPQTLRAKTPDPNSGRTRKRKRAEANKRKRRKPCADHKIKFVGGDGNTQKPKTEKRLKHVSTCDPKWITELTHGECKFGVYTGKRQLFCAEVAEPGRPYCAHHMAIAYTKAPKVRIETEMEKRRRLARAARTKVRNHKRAAQEAVLAKIEARA